jgi:DNA polymerase III delta prime subunit
VVIFHLLKNGRPTIDVESLKELFEFLKFANAPKKHWTNSSEWGMARAMHNVVLKQMKVVLQQNKLISINCDEVTTLDNQS